MFIPFLLTWVKYLKKATQGKNVYFGSAWGHSHGVGNLRREPWKADEQQHGEMKAHIQLWFLFLLVLYFRLDPEWTLNGCPQVGWVFILQWTQSRNCQAWSQASSLSDARLCPVEINSNHHDWRYELLMTIMGMVRQQCNILGRIWCLITERFFLFWFGLVLLLYVSPDYFCMNPQNTFGD